MKTGFIIVRYIRVISTLITEVSGLMLGLFELGVFHEPGKARPIIAYLLVIAVVVAIINWIVTRVLSIREARKYEEIIVDVLNQIVETLRTKTQHEFRANIMVPEGLWKKKLRIKFFSDNMKTASDLDLVFEERQGCAGTAWKDNKFVYITMKRYHVKIKERWNLSDEMVEKTKNLKTIISRPFKIEGDSQNVDFVINIDSNSWHANKPIRSTITTLIDEIDGNFPIIKGLMERVLLAKGEWL